MDIQIRQAGPGDHREIARIDGISFGAVYTEQDFSEIFGDPPSFLVATERDQIVGVSGDRRFRMTVPGGAVLDVPGVTWVSVLPTHRRRGVLSRLLEHQHAGYASGCEPLSILTASEGGIYRRFGYGPATQKHKTVVNHSSAELIVAVDSSTVEMMPKDGARTVLPELHRRWRASTPGAISRTDGWWDRLFRDRESQRGGMSETFYLVHPDGYVSYRVAEDWNEGLPTHRCVITDYRILSDAAHAALWQVLLSLDLFGAIETWEMPPQDHLPFLLTNPRHVRVVAINDGLWLRPIDIAAMLSARRYIVDIDAVIEVAGTRVRLSGGRDGVNCEVSEQPVDVYFSLPGLGSAYLGGYRVSTLARAGMVQVDRRGLLQQLDLAFGSERAPEYGTAF